MKNMSLVGGLLIALGIVALVYQGFTYTSQKNVIDIGPIKATVNEEKTIPIPAVVGGLMLAAGAVILFTNRKAI